MRIQFKYKVIQCYSKVTYKVAMQPGEPGKVRELDISPKNQGKVREFPRFIQNPGKVGEFEKILRLEVIFMPTLKPNF